jgi:hypothetical protein
MIIPRSIMLAAWLMPLTAWCGSSQNYTLAHSSIDNGGSQAASTNYVANLSSTPGGSSASANYANRTGYAGQLADVVAIKVAAALTDQTIIERGSKQFVAVLTYDDASSVTPAAELVSWNISGTALLSVSSSGQVMAGSVYQDTAAAVSAGYLNFSDTLSLVVLNSGTDDFGSYAADGLPDLWQVQYFGESGIQTSASADADSDGLTNLQEYAFGMNPSQSSGGMLRWSGSNLLERGLPVPYASGTGGGFTFRAVFPRRKDFATAGLTYSVEFSGDLATWKTSASTPTVLADDGEIQVVSVPYPFFVNGKKAAYFRVKVQSR